MTTYRRLSTRLHALQELEARNRHPSGTRTITLGDGSQVQLREVDGSTYVAHRDHTDAPWSTPVELEDE